MSRGTIDWSKILSDDHTQMMYNEHLLQITNNNMDYDSYQEAILQAGALTATHHKKQCTGWFQMSRATLAPLLTERNQVLHALKRTHHLSPDIHATMQSDLKQLNRHIAHAVSHAKATWYADVCSKIHNMSWIPDSHGRTFVFSQKAKLHTMKRRPQWQCAFPMARVPPMPLRTCLFSHPISTEFSTLIATPTRPSLTKSPNVVLFGNSTT
jgi:hypothetical protein